MKNNTPNEYSDKEFAMMVNAATAAFFASRGMSDVNYTRFNKAHWNEDAAPEDFSGYDL